jgi:RNA polymerase sigma factor (sigma-70 family)
MPVHPSKINKLADHLFRQESGKMVSVLTRIFGTENLETVEDVMQETFLHAFKIWPLKGIPENPSAWLFTVAKNKALNVLKRNRFFVNMEDPTINIKSEQSPFLLLDSFYNELTIKDDMLRMMFACCHSDISEENQVTIILKLLCGFSTVEIAKAFLTSEDTISKRLYRTKEFFRLNKVKLDVPLLNELKARTNSVLNSIYLLFNEGYNSTDDNNLIRRELIDEAMMLCKLLVENKHTQQPETYALMALICFHSSRSDCRLTAEGEIILLPYQDRTKWDGQLIRQGNHFLNLADNGNMISNYHLEAAIAFEYCIAETFEKTNWERIIELFDWQMRISPSPITALNRAVVILQFQGTDACLTALENISNNAKIKSYYLYNSLLGEINYMQRNFSSAKKYYEVAISQTHSQVEKKLLKTKIEKIS